MSFLNKCILRVRYLNNRKLANNLLKHDYKISKKCHHKKIICVILY